MGILKLILFTAAETRVPLIQVGHEFMASPTVKNRLRSTDWGTLAGYWGEFRLFRALLKLEENAVSFGAGIRGSTGFEEIELPVYCNIAVAVLLSTDMGASMNTRAAMKYLPVFLFVWSKTLVVCPGAISIAFVSKGFVYVASTSTTVRW